MALTCFPDNTVLINFGYLDRFDLLEQLLPQRMWCLTVSRECDQSYARRGFTTYATVRSLFGEPLVPTRAESINLNRMRDDLAAPKDKPDAHIGEAETITLIKSRGIDRPILVTDDLGATALAKQEGLNVTSTWGLLKMATRSPRIEFTEQDAWTAAATLRRNRRGWPKGVGQSRADFIEWLRAS